MAGGVLQAPGAAMKQAVQICFEVTMRSARCMNSDSGLRLLIGTCMED